MLLRTAVRTGATAASLVVAAASAAIGPAGPAAAADSGRGAFFLADQPTAAKYVPADQHVQSGSSVVVTRQARGVYRALVPDMADPQASLTVGTVDKRPGLTCDPSSWSPSGADELVVVTCAGPGGSLVDAAWDAVLSAGLPAKGRVQSAAARVDVAGKDSVPTVQHDDAGGVVQVRHLGTGSYEVTVPGFPLRASVLAQAVDPLPASAAAPGAGPSVTPPVKHHLVVPKKHHLGTGLVLDVTTTDAATGAKADSTFSVSVVLDGNAADDPTLTTGYGTAASGSAAKQVLTQAYDPAGGTPEVVRLGTGRYEAQLPGLGSSAGVAQVGALAAGRSSCAVLGTGSSDGAQLVEVGCAVGGTAADRPFSLVWTGLIG